MKKMPCLFVREFEDHKATITSQVTPGCEWVLSGEGVATIKLDGTSCAIIDGELYARYDCKPSKKARKRHKEGVLWKRGQFYPPPGNATACQEPDLVTGHWPHWVPVNDEPQYKYHREAFADEDTWQDGTYELIGEKVNGNPESVCGHLLISHDDKILITRCFSRGFDGIKISLNLLNNEGIVFHHPDGRMCKIRRKDFGFSWPIERE